MKLRDVQQFLWRNRLQITLAVTAVAATAGIISYVSTSSSTSIKPKDNEEDDIDSMSNEVTTRKLILIRQQFDSSSKQIFPTLRMKITEVVDVLHTIKQIKALRMNNDNQLHNADVENGLWEEIKVLSFTLWLVSIYASCSTCILLRVQLFLLSRYKKDSNVIHDENFEALTSGTYSHLFEKGIVDLVDIVRSFVAKTLATSTVKDKVSYQYEEFNSFIIKVRHFIERETKDVAISLIMPRESMIEEQNSNSSSSSTNSQITESSSSSSSFLNDHFAELWDIVESPMFSVAFTEACDTCFRRHLDILRHDVFSSILPHGTNGLGAASSRAGNFSSPPLASLLPQLKSLASNLLPSEGVGYEINQIYIGPAVDSLCISILDTKRN